MFKECRGKLSSLQLERFIWQIYRYRDAPAPLGRVKIFVRPFEPRRLIAAYRISALIRKNDSLIALRLSKYSLLFIAFSSHLIPSSSRCVQPLKRARRELCEWRESQNECRSGYRIISMEVGSYERVQAFRTLLIFPFFLRPGGVVDTPHIRGNGRE